MAKFRCLLSGTIVEFIYPVDIETTQENPAYEEIDEDGLQEEEQDTKEKVKKTRKAKETK